MSNSGEKTTNGTTTDPMKRLASFKSPRDLSLGGAKPNKKVFVPNLNVSRNKSKGPAVPNLQKKDDKGRRGRRNDKNNRTFNRNGPNVIKSAGVFSEGLGSAERHSSRSSYGRDTDSSSTLQRPTIRVKDVVKIDKELEEQKIKSVMGDISGLSYEVEDFRATDEKDKPVKLPMDDGGWSLKPKPTVTIKQEVVVKMEPDVDVDCAISQVQKPVPGVKKEVFEDNDVVDTLKSEQPTLILLQLPDSLPGRGGSVDDEPRRKNNVEPSTSSESETEAQQVPDNRCRLSDLEEGKIGKLQIHRSGRVYLVLGDTKFEVCSGTKSAFHQEVVSLAVDEDSRSATLVALGAIQHKLNLVPDWETMFQNISV